MENDDESFSQIYRSIRAEEASFLHLFLLLVSSDVRGVRFVSDVEEKLQEFEHRWIIFVPILAQRLLILLRKPHGDRLVDRAVTQPTGEQWQISRSPRKHTHREADCSGQRVGDIYVAMNLWNIDPRNDLQEGTINHPSWEVLYFGLNSDLVIVAFGGTRPFDADEWCTNIDISWYEIEGVGRVHSGFMKALGLYRPKQNDRTKGLISYAYPDIKRRLWTRLENDESLKFMVTGHSLGAALATLFVAGLVIHKEEWMLSRLEGALTFGQPRVGDAMFGEYMNDKIDEYGIKGMFG